MQGGKTHQDRELAARVRSLALEEIESVLKGTDEEYKKALVLKMSTSILPRLNAGRDEDEQLFPTPIYGGKSVGK